MKIKPCPRDPMARVGSHSMEEYLSIYMAWVLRISKDKETAFLSSYDEVEPQRYKVKPSPVYNDLVNALVYSIDIVHHSDGSLHELRTSKADIHIEVQGRN